MFVGCPHHASKLDRRSVPTCPAPFFLLKRVSFGGNGSFARAGGAEASSSCKKDPRFAMSRQHNREKRWEECERVCHLPEVHKLREAFVHNPCAAVSCGGLYDVLEVRVTGPTKAPRSPMSQHEKIQDTLEISLFTCPVSRSGEQ